MEHESIYRNRHGDTALNVLIVCGYSGKIYFCSTANVGSKHDSPILMESEVPGKMEYLKERGLRYPKQFIAGDNAYQSHLWWLCTPFLMEETATDGKKAAFNKWFCGARATVERVIGILKKRFPILKKGFEYENILDSIKVINICIAMHNYIVSKSTAEQLVEEERLLGPIEDDEPPSEILQFETTEVPTNVKMLDEFSDYFVAE